MGLRDWTGLRVNKVRQVNRAGMDLTGRTEHRASMEQWDWLALLALLARKVNREVMAWTERTALLVLPGETALTARMALRASRDGMVRMALTVRMVQLVQSDPLGLREWRVRMEIRARMGAMEYPDGTASRV